MSKKSIILVFLSLLVFNSWAQEVKVQTIKEEFLFTQGEFFQQCHASTIEQAASGTLLAAWFGGTEEGHKDVAIWGTGAQDGRWSSPEIWADGRINDTLQYPCWNPVLFKSRNDKTIHLFYKVGPNPREWWGMVKTSTDEGKTWGTAQRLPDGILGPIKNKPLELPDGTIISPSSVEVNEDRWRAHVEISEDQGKTWTFFPIDSTSSFNVIQPSVLLHADGSLQVLCRSKEGVVATAWSEDQGKTWSALSGTNLENPNSGTDAISFKDFFLIVYNPELPGKEWWEGRTKLRLAFSRDGMTWEDLLSLEDQDKGEFSYPTIFKDSEGLVHITYTYNRVNIKHWVLQIQ